MIAHIRGHLLSKHLNQAIIDCGGVGYDVTITVPTFSDLPDAGAAEVSLHIHTHVREDQIALYGFLRVEERRLFEKLISVSGIGPKLAITILSGMPVGDMVSALRSGEVARLTKIPGIGKKIAERMVLELREKLEEFVAAPAKATAPPVSAAEEDVISALVNLGYQRAAAEKAVGAAGPANGRGFDVLFRQAMAALTK
jgi:Holliday junction DNA helicase RuvA